jgi:hypothetical protein
MTVNLKGVTEFGHIGFVTVEISKAGWLRGYAVEKAMRRIAGCCEPRCDCWNDVVIIKSSRQVLEVSKDGDVKFDVA